MTGNGGWRDHPAARDRTTFDEAADAAGRFTQTTREPTARGIRLGADIRF
ncbi:MAG: hypothetical protein U1F25_11260 [Rubrivivax sp.]